MSKRYANSFQRDLTTDTAGELIYILLIYILYGCSLNLSRIVAKEKGKQSRWKQVAAGEDSTHPPGRTRLRVVEAELHVLDLA